MDDRPSTTVRNLTRRELLRRLAGYGRAYSFRKPESSISIADFEGTSPQTALPPRQPRPSPTRTMPFSRKCEAANFRYFWEQANPDTGIVRDRCNVRTPDKNDLGSIAATGFGLTALCIGEKRGFISHAEARDRVLNTLRFHWKKLPNHRGFFYHWANINTGERLWDSEVSSIDTAILLCGILTCRQSFRALRNQHAGLPISLIAWTGAGSRKILRSCRTDGGRKAASCNIAGTTTVR